MHAIELVTRRTALSMICWKMAVKRDVIVLYHRFRSLWMILYMLFNELTDKRRSLVL